MSFSKSQILKGEVPDGDIENIKLDKKQNLKTVEISSDRELLERQTILLELISLKLNCFQVDEITEDDIET